MWSQQWNLANRFSKISRFTNNENLFLNNYIVSLKKKPNTTYSKWNKFKQLTEEYRFLESINTNLTPLTSRLISNIINTTPLFNKLNLKQYRCSSFLLHDLMRHTHSDASKTRAAKLAHFNKQSLDAQLASLIENSDELSKRQSSLSLIYDDIAKMFPTPKHTIDTYMSMVKKDIYDISYKHTAQLKKSSKKTILPPWKATAKLLWPEKHIFEGTGTTKSSATSKALHKLLHYLFVNERIDCRGKPIHLQEDIDVLGKNLNAPLEINIDMANIQTLESINATFHNKIHPLMKQVSVKSSAMKTSQFFKEDEASDDEGFHENKMTESNQEYIDPIFGVSPKDKDPEEMQRRSHYLLKKLQQRKEDLKLPIYDFKQKIIDSIGSNRAIVIRGAPGCGKSTFVPTYLLDSWTEKGQGAHCSILVSEPRRVAALSLTERVAELRGESVGDVCGHQVRLSTRLPRAPGGSIVFCTAGSLLRRLAVSPDLPGCTYLLLDEAHERSADIDSVMALAKKAMKLNRELKVVVMSATIDTELFSQYFNNCPILDIPGFMYDVKSHFLENFPKEISLRVPKAWKASENQGSRSFIDAEEIFNVIKWVDESKPEGAILVFLPGWNEIKNVKYHLEKYYEDDGGHQILPIHSRLSNDEQRKIFSKPPNHVRKIILATNIAETSITINDVSYVIDTGVHKELKLINTKGISSLDSDWISKSNVKQRKGRAGRVKPGECFHMYTKDKMLTFPENPIPEIMRVPLEKIVLDCKSYSESELAVNFLKTFPQPPSVDAIKTAVMDLIDLGALDEHENLTALGKRILSFTTHPKLSKALIHGAILNVTSPILDLTTILSNNTDIFTCSVENRNALRNFKRQYHRTSDHQAAYWILQSYNELKNSKGYKFVNQYCKSKFMRSEKIESVLSIREIYVNHLQQCKILPKDIYERGQEFDEKDSFSEVDELVKGVLYSGLNTLLYIKNILKVDGQLTKSKILSTDMGQKTFIRPESVNHGIEKQLNSGALLYCGAIHSEERRGMLVKDTSLISPLTIFIFSSNIKRVYKNDDKVIYEIPNKRIKIQCSPDSAEILMNFRKNLWSLVDFYIKHEGLQINAQHLEYSLHSDNSQNQDIDMIINNFKNEMLVELSEILIKSEIKLKSDKKMVTALNQDTEI